MFKISTYVMERITNPCAACGAKTMSKQPEKQQETEEGRTYDNCTLKVNNNTIMKKMI
jgi:hypothetical protein